MSKPLKKKTIIIILICWKFEKEKVIYIKLNYLSKYILGGMINAYFMASIVSNCCQINISNIQNTLVIRCLGTSLNLKWKKYDGLRRILEIMGYTRIEL